MLIVKLIFTPISPYLRVDVRLPFVYERYTLGIARSLYADSQVDFHPYITLPHPYIILPHPISHYLTPISHYLRVDVSLPFVYERYTLGIARSLYTDGQVDFHPYITLPQSWCTPPICL